MIIIMIMIWWLTCTSSPSIPGGPQTSPDSTNSSLKDTSINFEKLIKSTWSNSKYGEVQNPRCHKVLDCDFHFHFPRKVKLSIKTTVHQVTALNKHQYLWQRLRMDSSPNLKDKANVCNQCNFQFRNKSTLRIHMKGHTGELHSCKQCEFATSFVGNLRRHMKIHSGEK